MNKSRNNKSRNNKSKIENLYYKNKYLKYKNKYFKLHNKNIQFKGGMLNSNIIIISVLISILTLGGFILYNQINLSDNTKTDSFNLNISNDKFMNDLKELINSNGSINDFLDNYYKYSNINLADIIEDNKFNTNKINTNKLILNYILNNNLFTPIKLRNIKKISDTRKYSDTFILCLEDLFNRYPNYSINNKNYDKIKKELIDYIEKEPSFNKFFEYDKTKPLQTVHTSFNFINSTTPSLNTTNTSIKVSTKADYIEYMRKSEDSVSDIPMIKAAAELYEKYIVVKMELSNVKYLKIFKPNITKRIRLSKSNIILLEYINMCDYNCDFIKNITNEEIKKEVYKNKNIKNNKNYLDLKFDNLYSINNINNIDNINNNSNSKNNKNDLSDNYKNINLSVKDYNQKKILDDSLSLDNNKLIHYEKQDINQKISIRPYYQYYEFYNPQEIDKISDYTKNIKN